MPKTYYTQAHNRATQKWEKANIYKATAKFPKEWEAPIKEKANQVAGGSVNAYIKSLVEEDLFGTNVLDEPTNEKFEDAP